MGYGSNIRHAANIHRSGENRIIVPRRLEMMVAQYGHGAVLHQLGETSAKLQAKPSQQYMRRETHGIPLRCIRSLIQNVRQCAPTGLRTTVPVNPILRVIITCSGPAACGSYRLQLPHEVSWEDLRWRSLCCGVARSCILTTTKISCAGLGPLMDEQWQCFLMTTCSI